MAEQILVEYKVLVDGLKADMKAVQTTFKETEKAGVDAANKTGAAFVKVEEKTKSLKSQLRELKAQLATATDPKDIERLARAAGKLTDQLEDASDAAKVFASESKFEQLGNALGSIGSKLRNLDFKGVAEQSKLLSSVISSFSFKDVIQGAKAMGVAFLEMGKAMLLNPYVLAAAAIVGLGFAIKSIFDSEERQSEILKENKKDLEGVRSATEDLIISNRNLKVQIDLTNGIITKGEAERGLNLMKYGTAQKKLLDEQKAAELAIEKKFQDEKTFIAFLGDALLSVASHEAEAKEKATLSKKNQALSDIQRDYENREVELSTNFWLEQSLIDAKATKELREASEKERADKIRTATDSAKERLKLQKQDAEELKKATVEIEIEIAKIKNENILKSEKEETQILLDEAAYRALVLTELNEKLEEDDKKRANERAEELAGFRKAQGEFEVEEAQRIAEIKKKIEEASIDFIIAGISAIGQISANVAQGQIQEVNDKADSEIKALDSQLKNKLISEEQYEKKKDTINEAARKKESDIKRKQFEIDKTIASIQVLINTALAVSKASPVVPLMILAAATGAVQLAVIQSQPTPKFAKGVVGLQGAGTGTSDSIHAMLSKNESVVTSDATTIHRSLLEAMNKNQGQKYIQDFYIAPALKAQLKKNAEFKDSSFASNIANSLALHGTLKDGNLLDSLKQSRKSDRENAIFIAKAIASQNQNKRNW